MILWQPNAGPQSAFLSTTADEVLYGGAVGGGKTDALLVWPLHRVHNPQHRSIYFRRERKRLQESIDRAQFLYGEVDPLGQWHETELRYKWSTGAMTQFAFAENEKDIEAWKSFEFDLVLFDEVTEFTEWQYKFMFMRNRSKTAALPAWTRCGTNPGGIGMAWVDDRFVGWQANGNKRWHDYQVYEHFVEVQTPLGPREIPRTRQYIPSTIFDNPRMPGLDAYLAQLGEMPDAEKEMYLYGRWGRWEGQFFTKLPAECEHSFKSPTWYVIRCLDYGFDDPTCILWLACYPTLDVVEVIAEVCESGMTTDAIAQMVQLTEQTLHITPEKIAASVMSPDAFKKGPEGSQSIASMLTEKGIWFIKANADRIGGWAQLRRLIERGTLRVWQGQAPKLLTTMPRLPRDPDKRDDIKAKARNDHAAEALRYGVMAYVGAAIPAAKKPTPSRFPTQDPYWEDIQAEMARMQRGDSGLVLT